MVSLEISWTEYYGQDSSMYMYQLLLTGTLPCLHRRWETYIHTPVHAVLSLQCELLSRHSIGGSVVTVAHCELWLAGCSYQEYEAGFLLAGQEVVLPVAPLSPLSSQDWELEMYEDK